MSKKHSKTVAYILGAGFSYGAGHTAMVGAGRIQMPLQNSLLKWLSVFNYRKMYRLDSIARQVRKYFNPNGYRTTRKSGSKRHEDLFRLSVEEIVTFFDESITTNHPDKEVIAAVSRELFALTTELISYLSQEGKPGNNPLIKKFVKKHVRRTDLIVTFNWDTLLDRVLENNQATTNWNRAWGYGRIVRSKFINSRSKDIPKMYPKLLKLHGSVNWTAFSPHEKAFDICISKAWGINSNHENVVMMPPKMIKTEIWRRGYEPSRWSTEPNGGVLRGNAAMGEFYPDMWKEAEERLSVCKKIVFIGYSFPPADYAVTNMLRRALSNIKISNQTTPDIVIVDPNASELSKRFENSFNLNVPIANQFLSLSGYLNNPRI